MNFFLAPARPLFLSLPAGLLMGIVPGTTFAQGGFVLPPGSSEPHPGDTSIADSAAPSSPASSAGDSAVVTGVPIAADTLTNVPPPDRSPGTDNMVIEDHPRIEQWEYMDAGAPRYTLTGNLPYRQTYIQTGTMTAFGGALLGIAGAITWYQQAWYPDSTKGPFNFQVDWSYAKEFDKVGHAFGGWMASYCSYEAFIASGLSQEDAAIWGAAGGLFFQTFIE